MKKILLLSLIVFQFAVLKPADQKQTNEITVKETVSLIEEIKQKICKILSDWIVKNKDRLTSEFIDEFIKFRAYMVGAKDSNDPMLNHCPKMSDDIFFLIQELHGIIFKILSDNGITIDNKLEDSILLKAFYEHQRTLAKEERQ